MEREAITRDELIAIYNVCKKRLTISLDDFLNNSDFEEIKNTTVERFNSLKYFITHIKDSNKLEIFKNNVCEEFGKDNFTDENMYAYYVDRIHEFSKMYKNVELNKLFEYCLKNRKLRNIEIKNSELIKKDQEKIKLNGLYDYLLRDTGINKERFLNLNDDYYKFERILILTIDSNIDKVRENITKLDDKTKDRIISAVQNRYHLVEVNGYYICRYLFDNFRMIKTLKENVGYDRLSPDNFMDIFKCSLNVGNVNLAYRYSKKDKGKLIKNAYLELKDNGKFRELVNLPKDNYGITFTVIKLLGKNLEEVNEINKYLGFINKISLSKYTLMSEYDKKRCLRESIVYYKKKVLRGTYDSSIKFIKKISLFEGLREEDKKLIISNYRSFIEEVFNITYEVCLDLEFRMINDLIDYVSNQLIKIIMINAVNESLNINKIDYIKNNSSEYDDYLNNYGVLIAREDVEIIIKECDSLLKEFENEKYSSNIDSSDKERDERIKEWKEQLLLQYKNKFNDNNYEFFGALYDLLDLYERKTGKKYDPSHCLFSFEDVYNYFYFTEDERRIFEEELIIEEVF